MLGMSYLLPAWYRVAVSDGAESGCCLPVSPAAAAETQSAAPLRESVSPFNSPLHSGAWRSSIQRLLNQQGKSMQHAVQQLHLQLVGQPSAVLMGFVLTPSICGYYNYTWLAHCHSVETVRHREVLATFFSPHYSSPLPHSFLPYFVLLFSPCPTMHMGAGPLSCSCFVRELCVIMFGVGGIT